MLLRISNTKIIRSDLFWISKATSFHCIVIRLSGLFFLGFCHLFSCQHPLLVTSIRSQMPLVSFTTPLHTVCYSCWFNFKNVPNPLSVLLPQRNTKWIRQDYCLPLPPVSLSLPLFLLWAVALSSSSSTSWHLPPSVMPFSSWNFFSRWLTGSMVTEDLTGPLEIKYCKRWQKCPLNINVHQCDQIV